MGEGTSIHLQRDIAIVLRSIAYQERDRVVTALTKNYGLISALAKNSIQSRRFGGSLDVFAASEWTFSLKPGAELYQLTEAQIKEPFEGIRSGFESLALASVFSELMVKIAPQNVACLELFKLHTNALLILNDLKNELPNSYIEVCLLNSYLGKTLQWSGNQPQIDHCLQCERTLEQIAPNEELHCKVAEAGWVCSRCRGAGSQHIRDRGGVSFQQSLLRLSRQAFLDLRLSLQIPLRRYLTQAQGPLQEQRALFSFLEGLLVFHIPGFDQNPIKSLRFLDLKSSAQSAEATLR